MLDAATGFGFTMGWAGALPPTTAIRTLDIDQVAELQLLSRNRTFPLGFDISSTMKRIGRRPLGNETLLVDVPRLL